MRVLMFGWEFPPYQAGGLATATVGLVKGLLRQGVGVTLVVPFPVTESPLSGLKLLGVEGAEAPLTVHRIPSTILPYGTETQYQEILAAAPRSGTRQVYGETLVAEVDRFASFAAEFARQEPHDVIDIAIHREKRLKKWLRAWKIDLIEKTNPHWLDLYPEFFAVEPGPLTDLTRFPAA